MSFDLKITNEKTGLSKLVDADKYTMDDFIKTYESYIQAGFAIKIMRGIRY